MYVGNQHHSTITLSKIVPFKCGHCSYEGKAQVTGIGRGQGNSAYFLDESGAKRRAMTGAEKSATKNIYETAKIAKCSNCGKRTSSNVQSFWLKQSMKLMFAILLNLGLGYIIYGFEEESFVIYLFTGCAVFSMILIYFTDIRWRWNTVDNRVIHLDQSMIDSLDLERNDPEKDDFSSISVKPRK